MAHDEALLVPQFHPLHVRHGEGREVRLLLMRLVQRRGEGQVGGLVRGRIGRVGFGERAPISACLW